MANLRTDYEDGELFLAEYINETNRAVNEGISTASQAAEDASGYLADLHEAIADLPDGQAVSAQVAVNQTDITGLKSKTVNCEDNLEDIMGDSYEEIVIQAVYSLNLEQGSISTSGNDDVTNYNKRVRCTGYIKVGKPVTIKVTSDTIQNPVISGYYLYSEIGGSTSFISAGTQTATIANSSNKAYLRIVLKDGGNANVAPSDFKVISSDCSGVNWDDTFATLLEPAKTEKRYTGMPLSEMEDEIGKIGDLEDEIANISEFHELTNGTTANGKINPSTGAVVASGSFGYYQISFDIGRFKKLRAKMIQFDATAGYAFYDDSGIYISGAQPTVENGQWQTIDVPATAKYFKNTYPVTSYQSATVYELEGYTLSSKGEILIQLDELDVRVDALEENVEELQGMSADVEEMQNSIGTVTMVIPTAYLESGSINGISGETFDQNSRVRTTGYLKVTKANFKLVASSTLTGGALAQIVFYTSGKVCNGYTTSVSGLTYNGSKTVGSFLKVCFKDSAHPNSAISPTAFGIDLSKCDGLELDEGAGETHTETVIRPVGEELDELEGIKISDTTIFPKNVYLVCNDCTNSAYNRNHSVAIYLDHCFRNLLSEQDIKFQEGKPYTYISSPISTGSTWDAVLNGGNNINVETLTIPVTGKNINQQSFNVKAISTKATPSKNITPRLLVIGSSTAWGEGATYHSKGTVMRKPYAAVCKEFFMKDAADQNGGNECILLGTIYGDTLYKYGNDTSTYKFNVEAYRGYTANQIMSGVFADDNGNFSFVNGWLKHYRTMDDSGNKLPWSAAGAQVTGLDGQTYTIGTLVDTEAKLNAYNVCAPTHVCIQIGSNGITSQQLATMISQVQTDFPDAYICLAMNDSMGTIFPSAYNDADASKCRWNLESGNNRHQNQFDIEQMFETYDSDTYKAQEIYVLPFFYISNPICFSTRASNLPEFEVDNSEAFSHETTYGWLPATHADVRVHYAYGYQLYAWIKYTLTKDLQ